MATRDAVLIDFELAGKDLSEQLADDDAAEGGK